jgi:transcriptional regulator with XRE-family HTH domain
VWLFLDLSATNWQVVDLLLFWLGTPLMRGIHVDGQRFRDIRKARGLSQVELAALAGVGERTVRNAESGRAIRLDFLRYLASALGVDSLDIAVTTEQVRAAVGAESRSARVLTAIEVLAKHRDFSELYNLTDKYVRIAMPRIPRMPFGGEWRGHDQFRRLEELTNESIEYDRPPEILEIRASGKFVILSGWEWVHAAATDKSWSSHWLHVYEFEKGRVIRLDTYCDNVRWCEGFLPKKRRAQR